MNHPAANSAFETSSLPAFRIAGIPSNCQDRGKALSKVRDRRVIVATLADGTTREFSVETEVDPEHPFDVPTVIAGQFCEVPAASLILQMKDGPVAVDSRRYRFTKIDRNGAFKLRKGW
jgi:hypothetical protein